MSENGSEMSENGSKISENSYEAIIPKYLSKNLNYYKSLKFPFLELTVGFYFQNIICHFCTFLESFTDIFVHRLN